MIYRNRYRDLQNWAQKAHRKPLILRGARQVGKTTLVDAFGKGYRQYLHLNLERKEEARLFEDSDSIETLMQVLALRQGFSIEEKCSLLFIDEIQNAPKAVALLRYFYEDYPDLHVIAAGSRLQSLLKDKISFPVGRVEYLQLEPCSFLEFLDATGHEAYAEAIMQLSVPKPLHQEVMKLFNLYALVGGMPEVLADYAEHRDLARLRPLYNTLLKGYDEDVEKYAPNQKQTQIIRRILERAWVKAGQTITMGNLVGDAYLSKDVREALDIMEKAFLLELIYPVTETKPPMEPAWRRAPKIRWIDTGLVNFAANTQVEIVQKKDLLDSWQGHVAEQVIAQELRVLLDNAYVDRLHFWVRDKRGSQAEVDYVWQQEAQLIPIEVKSGTNAHLRSLQSFMDLSPGKTAVRVWSGEFSVDDVMTPKGKTFRLLNIPFYYLPALPLVLERNML